MSDTPKLGPKAAPMPTAEDLEIALRQEYGGTSTSDILIDLWMEYRKEFERENAELRAKLEAADSVIQEQEIVIGLIAKALKVGEEPHQGYHALVLEAAEAAQRDAERYRWIQYRVGSEECRNILHGEKYLRGTALNARIDAAMQDGK